MSRFCPRRLRQFVRRRKTNFGVSAKCEGAFANYGKGEPVLPQLMPQPANFYLRKICSFHSQTAA
uniref:Uncharacterized protein n=1 Tax=Tupiella akineta TaxID=160070 RepID=Q6UVW4_TUPAK|nr:hypothetical protein PsakpMp02 [Tupiella akineta]AAQ18713.1 hypothetical protein [Tupiella akineta]